MKIVTQTAMESRIVRARFSSAEFLGPIMDLENISVEPDILFQYRTIAAKFQRKEISAFQFVSEQITHGCFLTKMGADFIHYDDEDLRKILLKFDEHLYWGNQEERNFLLRLLDAKRLLA